MTERQLEQYRLRKVGFVFQFFNLIPSLSAVENLELPMLIAGIPAEERRSRAETLLETVGLREKGFKRPEELSGGEQQRVAVCIALVNDPPIILADEPTGNLDSANAKIIAGLLVDLAKERGKTVIVASHDPKVVETLPARLPHARRRHRCGMTARNGSYPPTCASVESEGRAADDPPCSAIAAFTRVSRARRWGEGERRIRSACGEGRRRADRVEVPNDGGRSTPRPSGDRPRPTRGEGALARHEPASLLRQSASRLRQAQTVGAS